MGQRAFWEPRTVLVTSAGPIGLLAALVAKQHGLEVHVLDRVESGPKPDLVRALGATYHTGTVAGVGFEPDVIVECTGVGQLIADSIQAIAPGGVVWLTGVGSGGRTVGLAAADMASNVVLRNNVVVGSVNANKRHWYKAGGGTGARRPRMARTSDYAARATGGVHARAPAAAGGHQGRHSVCAGMIAMSGSGSDAWRAEHASDAVILETEDELRRTRRTQGGSMCCAGGHSLQSTESAKLSLG